ncbi:hypothetical protein EUGRSUZ_J00527 [Eucalyptus grandis]|uniref:Uncharacterized protein n=2 Tax=Eucalyptus grandis TaxID=71139 RepID=A0ACC3J3N0_EUCGR|nr:hypothetical protein EUGRSUZ_J00527 [Eucalyptus grandis]
MNFDVHRWEGENIAEPWRTFDANLRRSWQFQLGGTKLILRTRSKFQKLTHARLPLDCALCMRTPCQRLDSGCGAVIR